MALQNLPKEVLFSALEYATSERAQNVFAILSSLGAQELSQLISYVSIVPAYEMKSAHASDDEGAIVEANVVEFNNNVNADLYNRTIFDYSNTEYKYRGLVLLDSVNINVKPGTTQIYGGVTTGKISLKLMSVEAFDRIEHLMSYGSEFILSCGWIDGIPNTLSPYDIRDGKSFDWWCTVAGYDVSENGDGTWSITISFACAMANALLNINPAAYGVPNYGQLTNVYFIPKSYRPLVYLGIVDSNLLVENPLDDNVENSNPDELLTAQLPDATSVYIPDFSDLSKINYLSLGYEDDYYIQLVEVLSYYQDLINRNFIKNKETIKIRYITATTTQKDGAYYNEGSKLRSLILHEGFPNESLGDDKPVERIPGGEDKISVSKFTQIYIPLKFASSLWITSNSLMDFFNKLFGWINNRYDITLLIQVTGEGNELSVVNITEDLLRSSMSIPRFFIGAGRSTVLNHSFSFNDESAGKDFAIAQNIDALRTGRNEEIYIYDISTIIDNIDIMSANTFLPEPTAASPEQVNFVNKIRSIVATYAESDSETKKTLKSQLNQLAEENQDKLLYFKSEPKLNVLSNSYINVEDSTKLVQSDIDRLKTRGIIQLQTQLRPLTGQITVYGLSFFNPRGIVHLTFSDKVRYYSANYIIEEVNHVFSNNIWKTEMTLTVDVLSAKRAANRVAYGEGNNTSESVIKFDPIVIKDSFPSLVVFNPIPASSTAVYQGQPEITPSDWANWNESLITEGF